MSHHPGGDQSLLRSSSSGAASGWFLLTIRDKERFNSEVLVAPLEEPTQQTVSVVGWDRKEGGGLERVADDAVAHLAAASAALAWSLV